jgi:hypothetical protein
MAVISPHAQADIPDLAPRTTAWPDRSSDNPHPGRLGVPGGLVERDRHGPADRRAGVAHGRGAERHLVAGCRRDPGGDHRPGRAGAAGHERHDP